MHVHRHSHGVRHKKRSFEDWLDSVFHPNDDNSDSNGNDNGDGQVSIVYKTASATFDGPVGGYVTPTDGAAPTVGVGDPVQGTQTHTKPTTKPETHHKDTHTKTQPTTTKHHAHTTHPTLLTQTIITTDPNAHTTTSATGVSTATNESDLSTTGLGTTSETGSSSSTSDKSSESSPTASVTGSGSGGLSGGAKAGIAIGVILGVGLIAGFVLFWLRKKKQAQKLEAEDSEKTFNNHGLAPPPGPPPMAEPPRTPVNPPQLDVRPVTQFAPDLGSNNAAAAGALGVAGAAAGSAAAAPRNLTRKQPDAMPPPPAPNSSGSGSGNPFNDPVNPFGNQAEASSPPGPANPMSQAAPPSAANAEGVAPASDATPSAAAVGGVAAGAVAAGAAAGLAAKSGDKDLPRPPEAPGSRPESPAGSTDTGATPSEGMVAGAAPGAPPGPGPMNVHRVQMDFNPSMEDELSLQAGQLVRLLHEYDDGWVSIDPLVSVDSI